MLRSVMMMMLLGVLLCMAALQVLTPTLARSDGMYYGGHDHGHDPRHRKERFWGEHEQSQLLPGEQLPLNFTWCLPSGVDTMCTPSWNQHIPVYCGSCWVHGPLHMIMDRLKIAKKGKGMDVMLGRQTLLNCAAFHGYGHGCSGGDPSNVFGYMRDVGLPDESCFPYTATDHRQFEQYYEHLRHGQHECPADAYCRNCMPDESSASKFRCWAVKNPVRYFIKGWGMLEPGEEPMMVEIIRRGPISCGITCPEHFEWNYSSSCDNNGVYHDTSDVRKLTHDVEVVGWGVHEDGTKFWQVRNSWGTYWGELGFFKVERGANALQIETGDCWFAIPEHRMEKQVVRGELEGSHWGYREGCARPPDKPQQQQ